MDPQPRAQSATPAHPLWASYLFGPWVWFRATPAARPRAWFADVLVLPAAAAWFAYGRLLSDAAWLGAGVGLALWAAGAWARSLAGARRPAIARSGRGAFAHPLGIALLGLVVPGLGLMLAGARRAAAAGLWLVGPLVACVLVLAKARAAWPAGASGTALELVLAAAGAGVALTSILWLVQALEGARRMRPPRALAGADFASLALVVAALAFAITFRPVALARQVHTWSAAMQADGYRLIPLALCDAAAALDPATPAYAADGARLAEALGFDDLARDRRDAIVREAREWDRAAGPGRAADAAATTTADDATVSPGPWLTIW